MKCHLEEKMRTKGTPVIQSGAETTHLTENNSRVSMQHLMNKLLRRPSRLRQAVMYPSPHHLSFLFIRRRSACITEPLHITDVSCQ